MTVSRRALRPDAQAFDEVRIFTVPRYKSSGLSGDEWRISATIQFFRKGRLIHEKTGFRDVEAASLFLPAERVTAAESGGAYYAGEENFCDQEGCSQQASVRYGRLRDFCNQPHLHKDVPAPEWSDPGERWFCDRHSTRGDCAFDDADSNYELLSGSIVSPPVEDVRQSSAVFVKPAEGQDPGEAVEEAIRGLKERAEERG